MPTISFRNLDELHTVAANFLQQTKGNFMFSFTGDLGAGKTTFIKALCKHLAVVDDVTSPSFSIINHYFSPLHGSVYHFDFYRIKSISELYDIGIEEYFNEQTYIFAEWPQKAAGLLPNNMIQVTITVNADNSRLLHW